MTRHMLVVTHSSALSWDAAVHVTKTLHDKQISVVAAADQVSLLRERSGVPVKELGSEAVAADIELGIVLGGDGTILWAAEMLRDAVAPILGVNLGHVGFLAESERDDVDVAVGHAVAKDYSVDERLAIEVTVTEAGRETFRTWALNEATVEKAEPGRMIEVAVAVDGRPLSTFGCDGVVLATPTGSTAYSFSAGGPIVWPNVEALLMVPLSAHALFAKPLVVGPDSVLSVQLMERSRASGMLWCDGRRSTHVAPGALVSVSRSNHPVRLARLHPGPFTDRLVSKFALPVEGWRGGGASPA